ncbi:hypothetical protein V8D89_014368 [Ganoderma adspersum]
MPSQEDESHTLWGPVNMDRKRTELVEIATALGIKFDKKANKTTLVQLTKDHIDAHPGLAKEKRFQGLFAYRPDKQAAKPAPKSSADRDAEDAVEASKDGKPETGALKTLLDRSIPRDPPPRIAQLNTVTRASRSSVRPVHQLPTGDALEADDHDEFESEPTSKSPSKPPTPLPDTTGSTNTPSVLEAEEQAENKESAFWEMTSDSEVFGRIGTARSGPEKGRDRSRLQKGVSGPADEVHIPDSVRLKTKSVKHDDGKDQVVVDLSELLPVALEHASTPMKQRRARLLRPGVTASTGSQTESVVDIGSVAAFTKGERLKYLESDIVNKYTLEPMLGNDKTLVCRLFVRDDVIASAPDPSAEYRQMVSDSTQASIHTVSVAGLSATTTSGSETAKEPSSTQVTGTDSDEFIGWLRELIGAPKTGWGRANLIKEVLPRVKAIRAAVKKVSDLGWERSQGGYEVSADYPGAASFAGRRFKKEDITAVLWLRNTSANGYEQLFKPADMSKIPALQRWYDDPTGSEAATFEHLSIQKFIAWRDKRLKPSRSAKGNSKASRSTTLK